MATRNIIVVGAGAAGLTAALRAAQAGARVTLLNAHPRPGLKILMSGGTRCNVTHAVVSERDFHGGSRHVIARILRAFTVEQTVAWFQDELGVPLKLEETGKYFPESDDAQTVLDALLGACERAGVQTRWGARVVRVERSVEVGAGADAGARASGGADARADDAGAGAAASAGAGVRADAAGAAWRVGVQHVRESAALGAEVRAAGHSEWPLPTEASDEWLEADAIVLATGGLSFPRTGSDGTGYALVRALGHTLVPPVPALTPLAAVDPICRGAQGVTLEVELAFHVDNHVTERTRGSLLFAHFGLSGPCALDLSRHWHRADGHSRRVTLSFVPGESFESLERAWQTYATANPRRGVRTWLGGRLPDRIADIVTAESGIGGAAMSQIPRERRHALLRRLLARDIGVTGTLGYEKAEVTAGGVALGEVDASSLESRVAPGLWLCGEVLDVEGRLGGFNFQWSWSSGTVAGLSVAR